MRPAKEVTMTMLWSWVGAHQFAVTKISLEAGVAGWLGLLWRSYRREALARGLDPTITGFLGLSD
jgi:hypothetical protein